MYFALLGYTEELSSHWATTCDYPSDYPWSQHLKPLSLVGGLEVTDVVKLCFQSALVPRRARNDKESQN